LHSRSHVWRRARSTWRTRSSWRPGCSGSPPLLPLVATAQGAYALYAVAFIGSIGVRAALGECFLTSSRELAGSALSAAAPARRLAGVFSVRLASRLRMTPTHEASRWARRRSSWSPRSERSRRSAEVTRPVSDDARSTATASVPRAERACRALRTRIASLAHPLGLARLDDLAALNISACESRRTTTHRASRAASPASATARQHDERDARGTCRRARAARSGSRSTRERSYRRAPPTHAVARRSRDELLLREAHRVGREADSGGRSGLCDHRTST